MDSPSDPSSSPPPPLNYARPETGTLVLLARFGTADEAQLHAAELEAEGIATQIFNANVSALGIPYSGLSDVEVHVHSDDRARAAEVLRLARGDDLEPAGDPGPAEPPVDDQGNPVAVVPLSAFETVRQLRDAQTVLASARLISYPPKLVPRGDRPPGIGKRFVLHVAPEDVERAQFLLEQAQRDAGEELPHCPKCGGWRVYPVGHFLQSLAATFGLAPKPSEELECLTCRHRGATAEFRRSA